MPKANDQLDCERLHDPFRCYRNAQASIRFKPPGSLEWKEYMIEIGENLSKDLLPLPRDREIPWQMRSREETAEMMFARNLLASDLARQIADVLVQAFKANDPINGYSPQEWRKIQEGK